MAQQTTAASRRQQTALESCFLQHQQSAEISFSCSACRGRDGGRCATWCGRTARLPIVHLSVFKLLCIFAVLHHLLMELKMQDPKKTKGLENAGLENDGQTFSACQSIASGCSPAFSRLRNFVRNLLKVLSVIFQSVIFRSCFSVAPSFMVCSHIAATELNM